MEAEKQKKQKVSLLNTFSNHQPLTINRQPVTDNWRRSRKGMGKSLQLPTPVGRHPTASTTLGCTRAYTVRR